VGRQLYGETLLFEPLQVDSLEGDHVICAITLWFLVGRQLYGETLLFEPLQVDSFEGDHVICAIT